MLNVFERTLRSIGYAESEWDVPLPQGQNLHDIIFRLTGTVTVSGGTVSGTVVPNGVARLLKNVRATHDGFNFIDAISGLDLLYLDRRFYPAVTSVSGLANADPQVDTPIAIDLVIPLSPQILANPYDVHYAAQRVEQEFRLYGQFETARTTSASSPGSGALISGGDRTVTLNNVQIDVVARWSQGSRPAQFLPVISGGFTQQIPAASLEHPYELRTNRRVLGHLFQYRSGPLGVEQAGAINAATLIAGNVRFIDTVSYNVLKAQEIRQFPAVASADEASTLFAYYLDNGKLGTALDPKRMGSDPRWLFDVDAPLTSPGVIRVVSYELLARPGVTVIETN